MHGNAWQWCEDTYLKEYEELKAVDPFFSEGVARVARGGSWLEGPAHLRSARRIGYQAEERFSNTGFRAAVILPLVK